MKKLFAMLLLTAAFSIVGLAQKNADEKTLMKIEQELPDSIVGKKLSAIEKYYADRR
jgi:hypothetical protein